MTENIKLLPEVPVLKEYQLVKDELIIRIDKLNKIITLTEDNKKDVKAAIVEMNKIKDRISRFRIDETAKFLEYINPCVNQCKELEKLCVDGCAQVKAKVSELEELEKQQKIGTLKKLFEFALEPCPFRNLLKFEMFFEQSMSNKTSSITVIESQLKEWIANRTSDIEFINNNTDEAQVIIAIYLKNGFRLTTAIETHQEIYKNESEIKAMISSEDSMLAAVSKPTFEKKMDIKVSIKDLPKSKVKALESFLNGLGVDWEIWDYKDSKNV